MRFFNNLVLSEIIPNAQSREDLKNCYVRVVGWDLEVPWEIQSPAAWLHNTSDQFGCKYLQIGYFGSILRNILINFRWPSAGSPWTDSTGWVGSGHGLWYSPGIVAP